ncbi:MAG: MoaD/ThiS family protein [Desulfurococcaceae archaeon]|jgi:sulfur carrier protein ThiS
MRIKILESNEVIEIHEKEIRVHDLLRKLGLPPSEYIVIRNNTIVTEEDVLVDDDEVVVYTIKSGG